MLNYKHLFPLSVGKVFS